MKINIGIVGYGNLGKAAEKVILSNKDFNLVAIFSRRAVTSKFGTSVEPYENYILYTKKIDIMLLCGGSKSDLEIQTPEIARHYNCINTFDTHKKIPDEFVKLDEICKTSGHIALISCGWDPGLFSIVRALFAAVSKTSPLTFWGRGVSMGHSDAIRRIEGVEDAVQFTVPNPDAVRLAKFGGQAADIPLHKRECYVLAPKSEQRRIEAEIKNIPNYFLGQPTSVKFVDRLELLKLKNKLFHKGRVIGTFMSSPKVKHNLEFSVKMDSNPEFTASIMSAYILAVSHLNDRGFCGALTPLDVPVSFLFKKDRLELIRQFV